MVIKEKDVREGRRIFIEGTVQGVGFRPFVYRLASKFSLCGQVANANTGVVLEVEGLPKTLDSFLEELRTKLPPLAKITFLESKKIPPQGLKKFSIALTKGRGGPVRAPLPPDITLCLECALEIKNPKERRYLYPFTNCTDCGPRFTIVKSMPYDREKTSMENFNMCPDCNREYGDIADRRFHAQPIACPICGPQVQMLDREGSEIPGPWTEIVKSALKKGQIIALKGLGGFHLACDAKKTLPIQLLRKRKNRPAKPFAVMAKDLNVAKKYCHINEEESNLLTSPGAPITTLLKRKDVYLPLELAPGLNTLGVMFPYTPLHVLLFEEGLDLLVMTSGNRGGLPLVIDNASAMEELKDFADLFLVHNRDIVNRCDDSVVMPSYRTNDMKLPPLFMRRSRGYVPENIKVPVPETGESIFAAGGEMKNTFCILKGDEAYISQHLGEMDCLEGRNVFEETFKRWRSFIYTSPKTLAYDPHPGYEISRLVLEMPWEEKYPVQHHHAHMAAVMGEHGLEGEVLAAVLDGSGYGSDGNIWGFEILAGDYLDFKRLYHMNYLPLPGGEKAVKEPWRVALALLYLGGGEKYALAKGIKLFGKEEKELKIMLNLIDSSFNTPLASSGGRLFDAVAALMGLCQENTYEGEAAIRLSELTFPLGDNSIEEREALSLYPYKINGDSIDFSSLAVALAEDVLKGKDKKIIALRFHHTLADALTNLLILARDLTGLERIVLGGGVFQNRALLVLCQERLNKAGFKVYYPCRIPANDGGLSLGQALVATWRRWQKDVSSGTGKNFRNK